MIIEQIQIQFLEGLDDWECMFLTSDPQNYPEEIVKEIDAKLIAIIEDTLNSLRPLITENRFFKKENYN
jgi:ATP-dependent Zn protease